jgi:hypothetical protein
LIVISSPAAILVKAVILMRGGPPVLCREGARRCREVEGKKYREEVRVGGTGEG